MFKTTVLASLGLVAGTMAAETVHGVVVFTRHGDRTTKYYGNQQLTSLGALQNFQVGSDYRARYIAADSPHRINGISPTFHDPSQIYATAPNQPILLAAATSFLQGLYPPLATLNTTLTTTNTTTAPLNGYQYVPLSSIPTDSPSTIHLKGSSLCPAYTTSSNAFFSSNLYQTLLTTTLPLYQSLAPLLTPHLLPFTSLSFANAYTIYDLLNVASIHNTTTGPTQISPTTLSTLHSLASLSEFHKNYAPTSPIRSIAGATLTSFVLSQLTKSLPSTTNTNQQLKFTLLTGSYDTFLAFFGLSDLASQQHPAFTQLPDYASTMAWELFTDNTNTTSQTPSPDQKNQLQVRFLFRNGTHGTLQAWPLFGTGKEVLPWHEFAKEMEKRAVTSVQEWCSVCGSHAAFCGQETQGETAKKGWSDVNIAGVIGAMVTLGVVSLVLVGVWVVRKRLNKNKCMKGGEGGDMEHKVSFESGREV